MTKETEKWVKKGYFTVNKLIEKLQELKEKGFGDELVGSDTDLYNYCEFDSDLQSVILD